MFLYFLWYHPAPVFKNFGKFLYTMYRISFFFVGIPILIVVFGNLALIVYTKKNTVLQAQIIHNLPFIVKIFLIHSFWFVVVYFILNIFILFFTPTFARAKNHNIGKILMEVKWQRWRFASLMCLSLLFGPLSFIMFAGLLKMYAVGLTFLLICLWYLLTLIAQNSLSITEEGLLIGRIFSDVFIPYKNLYPLSEKDIQEALDDKVIRVRYGKESDYTIIYFDLIVRNGHQVSENFMNLYNEKVKEFRQNHSKDSHAN
ncbi:hypothetical protein CQA53_09775 [Helicobacter didelphidarum]|uniref:Uncharacterized protein n=1 Tax=Helicobacter didelphidarum TaxID=2040648 RepID=A0A3D8IB10_9HELI|nr:hypothetical protein [Helicobacter didelphidarum]RDU61751.1 hypothetical protein CQA53_09775 [Helicobacter didelphidarum]